MPAWLTVVGIGDGGLTCLAPEQRAAIDAARHVVGGARHLALLDGVAATAQRHRWSSPFDASRATIEALAGQPTVVLASGDPSWFGPVAWLRRFLPADAMLVLPSPSSFSLAAARLGWALEDVACLSAHGRPVSTLAASFGAGRRLLILSADGTTPGEVASLLVREGFGASHMTVLEHLGGAREQARSATAEAFSLPPGAALNVIAVDCVGRPAHGAFGLADEAFAHDGKMTKRPMRALALAALEPRPGACLWDIGSGCGSIAVEWARLGGRAIALEPRADRRALLAENVRRLAHGPVEIVDGLAPDALDGFAAPDSVFIGGGLSEPPFARAFDALPHHGNLVAHAVTLESEALLLAFHARYGGNLTRLAVSVAAPVGTLTGWRPQMPVTHWHLRKGAERA